MGATTTTTLPTSPQADLVLGQTSFADNGVNLVNGSGVFTPSSVTVDNLNNRLYVADTENSRILGFSNLSSLSSGALADIVIGQVDLSSSFCNQSGNVGAYTLCRPGAVAVDGAGNLYVADTQNNRVLEYDAPIVSGMAATHVFGQQGIFGVPDFNTNSCDQNSSISASSLCSPKGLAVDSVGNLYVADTGNNRVLEYNTPLTDAVADLVFGQGDQFTTNDCNNTALQVGGLSADSLCLPVGVALDNTDNLYVADTNNHRVLEYSAPLTDTTADIVIGQANMSSNSCNRVLVVASANSLCFPIGVAVNNGLPANLFVADSSNHRVLGYALPLATGMSASTVFGQGGSFTTQTCNKGGLGPSSLCSATAIALNSSGNLYLADTNNNRVLEYLAPLTTDTVADLVLGQSAFTSNGVNFVDAVALNTPKGAAVDRSLNPNRLYVADTGNNRVLGYTNITALITGAAADIVIGQADMNSTQCDKGNIDSDGLPVPDNTTLCNPKGLAVDSAGNLYIADTGNDRVLEYDQPLAPSGTCPSCSDAIADHVFGQADSFTTLNTPPPVTAVSANKCNNTVPAVGGLNAKSLCLPEGVAVDSLGNVYVADTGNNRVLEYDTPIAIVVSGTSTGGNLNSPTTGTLNDTTKTFTLNQYVNFLLEITGGTGIGQTRTIISNTATQLVVSPSWATVPAAGSTYKIIPGTTADRVFGQPDLSTNPSSCNNLAAPINGLGPLSLCFPEAIAVDVKDNLYVADTNNNRVLAYNAPHTDPAAVVVFGQPDFTSNAVNEGNPGDPPPPSATSLFLPRGVALDANGNLYIADTRNSRVLSYAPPLATGMAASTVFGQPDFVSNLCNNQNLTPDPPAIIGGLNSRSLCFPEGVAVDSSGNRYVVDTRNNRVLQFLP